MTEEWRCCILWPEILYPPPNEPFHLFFTPVAGLSHLFYPDCQGLVFLVLISDVRHDPAETWHRIHPWIHTLNKQKKKSTSTRHKRHSQKFILIRQHDLSKQGSDTCSTTMNLYHVYVKLKLFRNLSTTFWPESELAAFRNDKVYHHANC